VQAKIDAHPEPLDLGDEAGDEEDIGVEVAVAVALFLKKVRQELGWQAIH
jgi:hypothetical protein